MKAKISYTVNIDEIPTEINKLFLSELQKLENVRLIEFNLTKENIDIFLLKVESLRKILVDVDNRAAECYSIAVGLKKALEEKNLKEADNGTLPE